MGETRLPATDLYRSSTLSWGYLGNKSQAMRILASFTWGIPWLVTGPGLMGVARLPTPLTGVLLDTGGLLQTFVQVTSGRTKIDLQERDPLRMNWLISDLDWRMAVTGTKSYLSLCSFMIREHNMHLLLGTKVHKLLLSSFK